MGKFTGKTVYLRIDVHKNSFSITAVIDNEIVKRTRMSAIPSGVVNFCNKYFAGAKIESAYEAGFSGFHLHRFLVKNGINNRIAHPASIEISARDKVKTDKGDSQKIALQLSAGRLKRKFHSFWRIHKYTNFLKLVS